MFIVAIFLQIYLSLEDVLVRQRTERLCGQESRERNMEFKSGECVNPRDRKNENINTSLGDKYYCSLNWMFPLGEITTLGAILQYSERPG